MKLSRLVPKTPLPISVLLLFSFALPASAQTEDPNVDGEKNDGYTISVNGGGEDINVKVDKDGKALGQQEASGVEKQKRKAQDNLRRRQEDIDKRRNSLSKNK